MTKLLAILAGVGAGVLIVWITASRALSSERLLVGDVNWPRGGAIGDFSRQFPDRDENDSATRLLATAERFGERELREARPAMNDYLRRELSANGDTVAPPPPAVKQFLQTHANVIRTLRAQIISNPGPVWKQQIDDILDPPGPPLGLHMQLFLLLTTDALTQRSQQNDLAAWTDLRAAWVLSQSLWERPEIMSVLTAMIGTRMIAAAAVKLLAPPPPWWAEVVSFDVRQPLLRSMEYEAWAAHQRAERFPAGEPDGTPFGDAIRGFVAPLLRPIRAVQAGIVIGRLRDTAAAAATADPCAPFVIAHSPEWAGVVRRFNRFQIEREGVAKFLQLKAHRPPGARSVCKDAKWDYRQNGDAIELAFRGTIPPQASRVTIIPLTYRYGGLTAERR